MKYNGGVAANYTQQSGALAGPDTLHNETITSHLHNIRQDQPQHNQYCVAWTICRFEGDQTCK